MNAIHDSPPVVLLLAGNDPSGGAGIQADIQTVGALGCHPAPVITCLTEQDSRNVLGLYPLSAEWVRAQARALIADFSVAAIKIGLLGNADIARAVTDIIKQLPGIPVILDPVLAAGGGKELAGGDWVRTLLLQLLPLCAVITPNSQEARRLSDRQDLDQAAAELLYRGASTVLITGAHEATGGEVFNRLYTPREIRAWRWPRLEGEYHGSGCTLASALAALLARGFSLEEAAEHAQGYTWQALRAGFKPGRGQFIPDRRGKYWRE